MKIDPKIFRAYDIRGDYPSQINREVAELIARAFCYFLEEEYQIKQPKILIGYDARVSSPSLFAAVKEGLKKEGAHVFDAGFITTPLSYFGNWYFKMDGSIMITASHNPKEYNGFKLSLRDNEAFSTEKGTLVIKEIIEKEDFNLHRDKKSGKVEKISLIDDYTRFIAGHIEVEDFSRIALAIDFSNGSVGPFFREISKRFHIKYYGVCEKPDGNFPNHEPNPLRLKSLIGLTNALKTRKFNLGIAFDGDGDRTVFFDEQGNYIRADFILAVLVKYYLKKIKKIPAKDIKVVCDARLSRGVVEVLESEGVGLVRSKVGYPFIKALMKEKKALIGAELSGHFFWKDTHNSESGSLTVLRLLEVLLAERKPISELVKPIKKYYSSDEINFRVKSKEEVIEKLHNIYIDGRISKIDGLTVDYPDWWFNIRPSNTEPLLRLTVEANSKALLEKKTKELRKLIESK